MNFYPSKQNSIILQSMPDLISADSGFTLVELLVTISILAVIFGIVTLSLGTVGANAEDSTAVAECGVVQSAADIYVANGTGSITPSGGSTNITSANAEFSAYLRSLPTQFTYEWDASGNVTCSDVP